MDETLQEIREFKTKFEEFEINNEKSHMLIILHILRDTYESDQSDTTGETLGLISLWMGLISLFIVALLEGIISQLIGKCILIVFFVSGLFILILNFKYLTKSRKHAEEINSLILKFTSEF